MDTKKNNLTWINMWHNKLLKLLFNTGMFKYYKNIVMITIERILFDTVESFVAH